MGTKIFAQLTEFGFARILEAKLESMLGCIMVQLFHSRIGSQQLQTLAV